MLSPNYLLICNIKFAENVYSVHSVVQDVPVTLGTLVLDSLEKFGRDDSIKTQKIYYNILYM